MTSRYPWLLFDADDTLFDYGRAEAAAVRGAFAACGVAFEDGWLAAYQAVNARNWRLLEEGRISSARMRVQRWELLFDELGLGLDAGEFSLVYLAELGAQAHLIDGALELVEGLRVDHRIAIITNGISDVQRSRLARSPLASAVEHIVISEEVGAAKPHPAIFDAAMARWGNPDRREVLVIGDSLSSDIAGGVAAGIDTCWFNPGGRRLGEGEPIATYEIRQLRELLPLLAR